MSLTHDATSPITTGTGTERWVLVASVIASGMAFIDATALNVALPAIQSDFEATGTQLMWIVNSYAVTVAALLLLGGALGDRFGHNRVLMTGVVLFATASLACGLAPGAGVLINSRALQGVGAALMLPGSLSLLSESFDPLRRGRAIGIWSALSVVTTALGPVLGGLFAQFGFWRGVFFLNLPLALLCLAVLHRKVPESTRPSVSEPLDYAGAVLSMVGLAALSFGLIESAKRGWHDWGVIAAILTGVCGIAALVYVEARAECPLLPLSLFRDRNLIAAGVMTLCFYSGIFGMTFFLSLNLIQVQGYAAVLAGLAQVPLMVMVLLISPIAGYLVDRVGPRIPLVTGGCLASLGFAFLWIPGITAGPHRYGSSFFPPLCLLGLGLGFCAAPLTTTIVNSVAEQFLGRASGINAMLSRLSSVLGIAILGPLALQSFQISLTSQAAELSLSSREIAILRSESVNLAGAQPPPGMSQKRTVAVSETIKRAYVSAFRVVSLTCAVVVGLSTLLAFFLIKPRFAA